MRSSDCRTSSREVTRPSRNAACISGMVASTTLKGFGSGFFAARAAAARRPTAKRCMAGYSRPRYPRSMDSEVVEVLKEIRDEVKGTNARLDHMDARLDRMDGRLDHIDARVDVTNMRLESLENRVERGFEVTNTRLLLVETTLQRVEESVTK